MTLAGQIGEHHLIRLFSPLRKVKRLLSSQTATNILFFAFCGAVATIWLHWLRDPFYVDLVGTICGTFDCPAWTPKAFLSTDPEGTATRLGLWGDSFGALNALLSAFGFMAVVLTLIQQQRDQHRQRFDATFFEMLNMLREEREGIRFAYSKRYVTSVPSTQEMDDKPDQKSYRGRNAIRAAAREYSFWMRNRINQLDLIQHDPDTLRAALAKLYVSKVHSRYESRLGSYFRVMYTILEKVDSDRLLRPAEKQRYGNMLRAQMTNYEVQLAALNGLADFAKDFPLLIQKYRIMKYMRKGKLRTYLIQIYGPKAFAGRDENEGFVNIIPKR
ncbi:putative phage abortive infection protein [Aureimonas ureilytica]|uniref:putative phage abortive infection protein n=1 Tax=Aureimonas ureilytica TaxID=401562 RepID=UPI00036D1239|nr:putative phage abortive infection protein [Aureimonas ureilytica]